MSMASFLLTRTYLLFPVRQRKVCNGFFNLIKMTYPITKSQLKKGRKLDKETMGL